jgi:hypothetical protein
MTRRKITSARDEAIRARVVELKPSEEIKRRDEGPKG